MKIGIACTNNYRIPTPDNLIYAPQKLTGWIADGLAERGYDVTLFAPVGSKTQAKLETFGMKPFAEEWEEYRRDVQYGYTKDWKEHRRDASCAYENTMLTLIYNQAQEFDIFHMNLRLLSITPIASLADTPTVVTVHDPLNYTAYGMLRYVRKFEQIHYVSVSDAQRKTRPGVPWFATVYNGVHLADWKFNKKKGNYLAWAGRIIPEKGLHVAIRLAKALDIPLKIAGPYYKRLEHSEKYYHERIKPHLTTKIEHLGILPHDKMSDFYRGALAYINPIEWEEPFGLQMMESLACGTPVIAFQRGSVPELLIHAKTGYIVHSFEEMVEAVENVEQIDRVYCRTHVENNFTHDQMVERYAIVYENVLQEYGKRQ